MQRAEKMKSTTVAFEVYHYRVPAEKLFLFLYVEPTVIIDDDGESKNVMEKRTNEEELLFVG